MLPHVFTHILFTHHSKIKTLQSSLAKSHSIKDPICTLIYPISFSIFILYASTLAQVIIIARKIKNQKEEREEFCREKIELWKSTLQRRFLFSCDLLFVCFVTDLAV